MKKMLTATAIAAAAVAMSSSAWANPVPAGTVTVTTNSGGVQVGTSLPGQPLVGVSADNNGVCAGFSYQQTQCVPGAAR